MRSPCVVRLTWSEAEDRSCGLTGARATYPPDHTHASVRSTRVARRTRSPAGLAAPPDPVRADLLTRVRVATSTRLPAHDEMTSKKRRGMRAVRSDHTAKPTEATSPVHPFTDRVARPGLGPRPRGPRGPHAHFPALPPLLFIFFPTRRASEAN